MTAFVVHGEPMSKQRARIVNGHAYTPAATVAAEARVLQAFVADMARRKWEGPIAVSCHFYAATRIRRDIDNLIKLVLDALNGWAWIDDSQIQELSAKRVYVPKGEARTIIHIEEVAP